MTYEPPIIKSPSNKDHKKLSITGEIYRKKIEALRNDVGNGWLSVLSEEGWDAQKNTHIQGYGVQISALLAPYGRVLPPLEPTTKKLFTAAEH